LQLRTASPDFRLGLVRTGSAGKKANETIMTTTQHPSARDIQLVQESFAALEPALGALVEVFYAELFAANPQVRRMFPEDMSEQRKKLAATLKVAVNGASKLDQLLPALQALGEKHAAYGVQPAHFDAVGAALVKSLAQCAGSLWNEELQAAWVKIYSLIASVMVEAMKRRRASSLQPFTLRSAQTA
jgi:nitric oxide dioxygenase